jgi:hypothetical protein
MSEGLPRGALDAGATALEEAVMAGAHPHDDEWVTARIVLTAALPFIERHVRRQVAREVLELNELDRVQGERTNNRGPFYDMRTSLRRLARGETLPVPDYR